MSRSAKVKTVSRCMAARSFGMPATMTCSAAPRSNRAAATWVIAWREVRSLIPISTTPLPDRHDVAALERRHRPSLLGIAPPHRRPDEVGMELVDGLHRQRLVVAGRPVQRIHGQAAVEPAGGVAGVERVGQRRHQVFADAGRLAGQRDVARRGSPRAGRWWPGRRSGSSASWRGAGTPGRRGVPSTRPRPTWFGTILRSSSQSWRRGLSIVCATSTSWSSTTSTPRWAKLRRRSRRGRAGRSPPTSRRRRAGRRSSSASAGGARDRAQQTSTLRSVPDLGVHAVRRGNGCLDGLGHRVVPFVWSCLTQ